MIIICSQTGIIHWDSDLDSDNELFVKDIQQLNYDDKSAQLLVLCQDSEDWVIKFLSIPGKILFCCKIFRNFMFYV